MKKYLIFDLDGTLIESMGHSIGIIFNELSRIEGTDMEKVRYILSTTAGTPLLRQLEMIYEEKNVDCKELTKNIYEKLLHLKSEFFPGVLQKIKELKKDYHLFLTTGNSTPTALKHLQKGGILEDFDMVLGSDEIHKGPLHLEIFKRESGDNDFYQKSVYIGDGDADREYAKSKNIDFIHIGTTAKDSYEVSSVTNIDPILYLLNNQ